MFPSTLCLWCQICGSCLVALGDTTLPNGWSMIVVFYLDKTWIWRMHSLLGPLKFNLFQGSFKIQMVQWWKWMIWARKPRALDLMLMGIDKNQALVNFSVAWERGKPTKGLTLKVAGFDSPWNQSCLCHPLFPLQPCWLHQGSTFVFFESAYYNSLQYCSTFSLNFNLHSSSFSQTQPAFNLEFNGRFGEFAMYILSCC